MTSTLVLGFLLGLRHGLEADHVAAIAALANGQAGVRGSVLAGAAWGLGHGLAVLMIGMAALAMGKSVAASWGPLGEAAVAVMLLVLGLRALRRLPLAIARQRLQSAERGLSRRALVVGLMHGFAGSATLVVLLAAASESIASGIAFLIVFGAAAAGGMAVLSLMLGAMAHFAGLRWTGFGAALQRSVAAATLMLGFGLLVRIVLATSHELGSSSP